MAKKIFKDRFALQLFRTPGAKLVCLGSLRVLLLLINRSNCSEAEWDPDSEGGGGGGGGNLYP